MVKLSIITITYNNPDLYKTLSSVQHQNIDHTQISHIIVDNLSTDNTSEIVKKYKNSVNYPVIYIREKDFGRYNAMNKGIKKSNSEYLLFLNAGDSLYDSNVLSKVFEKSKYTEDILYGDILVVTDQKKKTKWSLAKYPINQQFFLDRTIFHQSAFIKNELFQELGPYNEKYKIVGDYEFFIRAIIKNHCSTRYLPYTISKYDTHGISSILSDKLILERTSVIMDYYSGKTYLYNFIKHFYYQNKKYFPKCLIKIQQQRLQFKPKI